MVYRIHFSSEDLARTRVAGAPLPMCELRLAVWALRGRGQRARLDAWRQGVRERMSPDVRTALSQLPPEVWSPTFLPAAPGSTPEDLLEQVRATPRAAIRAQVEYLAARNPIPARVRGIENDPALFQEICDHLGVLYATLLGPYWDQITVLHMADRTIRMRQMLNAGLEGLLSQVDPRWMHWNAPTLEVHTGDGADGDLVLDGQGILLAPSAFRGQPAVEAEALPQPVVAYPASIENPLHRLTVFTPAVSKPNTAVSSLLGSTRSAVLTIIAEHPGCSTKELAAFAGIAQASASEHASVLREAGLIRTTRHRNAALHSPTGLGITLLDAPAARP